MIDILVLGATGFTGRLIVRALHAHRQRSSFSFAIGVRSISKGKALKDSLGIDESVPLFKVDLSHYDEIEAAVKEAKVIVDVAGPFWIWGPDVVKACAVHGKRYVDLTGEPHFIRRIVDQYEDLATKTGAIIVPACGFDSIPSDLLVYLSNKKLKSELGTESQLGLSQTFFKVRGGVSGGSLATLIVGVQKVPRATYEEAGSDYALSRVNGYPSPSAQLAARVPLSTPAMYGGYWIMATMDRCVVQRSYGLNEFAAAFAPAVYGLTREDVQKKAYGPKFQYAEYRLVGTSWLSTALFTSLMNLWMLVMTFQPILWLMKKVGPSSGEGPSDKEMAEGTMEVTNYTKSATKPGTYAKSIMRGAGDPGYFLTAYMVAECAVAFVLDEAALPRVAHLGGILTPSTAFGDILVKRLEDTGLMRFESEIVHT